MTPGEAEEITELVEKMLATATALLAMIRRDVDGLKAQQYGEVAARARAALDGYRQGREVTEAAARPGHLRVVR